MNIVFVKQYAKKEASHKRLIMYYSIYRKCPEKTYMCVLSCFSHVRRCATLWTIACQAPLSTGFPRQEYWSGLPSLLQGIFPTQGLNPGLLCLLQRERGRLEVEKRLSRTGWWQEGWRGRREKKGELMANGHGVSVW